MPKRKHKDDDDQLEFLSWKIKKLKKQLGHRSRNKTKDRSRNRSVSSSERSQSRDVSPPITVDELLASSNESTHSDEGVEEAAQNEQCGDPPLTNIIDNDSTANPTTVTNAETTNEARNTDGTTPDDVIDKDLLEILGVDPSATIEYGKDIHNELASRLQHIATAGLTKETRKELNEKYLVPANCVKIGAPSMNPEIKAAVTETVMKRDKGIESRQKQLASAISGLADLLNREFESKGKDNTRLKQLSKARTTYNFAC